MADMDQNIAKMFEGNALALSAVAESLESINKTLTKGEQAAALQKEMQAEAIAKQALVNEIAASVVKSLQPAIAKALAKASPGESPQGLDVDGKSEKHVSGTSWPMGGNPAEDREKPEAASTPTKDVQKPITMSQPVAKDMMGAVPPIANAEDGSGTDEDKEFPNVESAPEGDGGGELGEIKAMLAQLLQALGGQGAPSAAPAPAGNPAFAKGEKSTGDVQKSIEAQMRKMGWKKSENLKPRVVKTLGSDNVPLIRKSDAQSDDPISIAKRLSELSFGELARMQAASMPELRGDSADISALYEDDNDK